MAYKLALPSDSQIHNVLHVSQLKKFTGSLPIATHIPQWMQGQEDQQSLQPRAIADQGIIRKQNAAVVEFLVQWEGLADHESSWEDAKSFASRFPDFMQRQP